MINSKSIADELELVNSHLDSGQFGKALEVYERLYDGKNPAVALQLGYLYGLEDQGFFDARKSEAAYRVAAEANEPYAQQALASILKLRGEVEEALLLLELCSKNGSSECSYLLFRHYQLTKDKVREQELLAIAVSQDHALAKQIVAIRKLKGEYGLKNIFIGLIDIIKNFSDLMHFAKTKRPDK